MSIERPFNETLPQENTNKSQNSQWLSHAHESVKCTFGILNAKYEKQDQQAHTQIRKFTAI